MAAGLELLTLGVGRANCWELGGWELSREPL